MADMEFVNIFSSFFAMEILHNIDNIELKQYALELRKNSPGVVKSNYGGWQSDIFQVPNTQVSILTDTIVQRAASIKNKLGFKEDYHFYLNNIWININQRSSFNKPHIHTECVLSGVYYVDCDATHGNIVFRHPSIIQQCVIEEDSVSKFTEFNAAEWSVFPEIGKLLIFPSWLEHYVEPNSSDHERISIAFNISIGNK
jgi:uncharacterized protein (TIGR02466 family)